MLHNQRSIIRLNTGVQDVSESYTERAVTWSEYSVWPGAVARVTQLLRKERPRRVAPCRVQNTSLRANWTQQQVLGRRLEIGLNVIAVATYCGGFREEDSNQ